MHLRKRLSILSLAQYKCVNNNNNNMAIINQSIINLFIALRKKTN